MDSYLLGIVEAAEGGSPTPGVHVITTGGDWIKGQPCSSDEFREITWKHYLREIEKELFQRSRRERKEKPIIGADEPRQIATEGFNAVSRRDDAEGSAPSLSLKQAVLSFGGRGDGMDLAVTRIPLAAVSSWWVSGGEYVKEKAGMGLFAGVVFPIGE